MIHRLAYRLINKAARTIKGESYQLDSSIPIMAIAGIAYRRLVCWVRSVVRGFSWQKKIFIGSNVELKNRRYIQLGYGVTLGNAVVIDGLSREGGDFGR